jgi:hypothetical protein
MGGEAGAVAATEGEGQAAVAANAAAGTGAAGGGEGSAPGTTALKGGAAPAAGTALEGGAAAPDPNATIEIPVKFKNEDGTLNEQAMFKSYGELEKKMGATGSPPATAEDYKIEDKFPEGLEVNAEGRTAFLGKCHERGMTNDQVQFIMDEYAEIVSVAAVEATNTHDGTVEQLKKLYGDEYHEKMASAMNAFRAAGVEGVSINDVGNHPGMIQILSVLGANLTEDQIPRGLPPTGGMSEGDLHKLMASEAYWDPKHEDHKNVNAKVAAYYKAKHANKKR